MADISSIIENLDESEKVKVLLSSISYTDEKDYRSFLENLTTQHAIIVLIAAATHAQKKGAFILDEAELIAKAIHTLNPKAEAASNEDLPQEEE